MSINHLALKLHTMTLIEETRSARVVLRGPYGASLRISLA